MDTVQLHVRIEKDTSDMLNQLLVQTSLCKEWVVNQALRDFIAAQLEIAEAVAQARADIAAGRGTDWGDVQQELDVLIETGA